jgi:hypothetical protein
LRSLFRGLFSDALDPLDPILIDIASIFAKLSTVKRRFAQKISLKRLDRDTFGGATLRNGTHRRVVASRPRTGGIYVRGASGVVSVHGGTHAKRKRPLAGGEWLHVCLKSSIARGKLSMLQPRVKKNIERIVKTSSILANVKISSWQNVGNHLHFSVKAPDRKSYNRWIRSVSGLIARTMLAAERGSAAPIRFWESRPFTRIIRGIEAFDRLSLYIKKNRLEAAGFSTTRAKEIVRMIAMKEVFLDQTAPIDISWPPE